MRVIIRLTECQFFIRPTVEQETLCCRLHIINNKIVKLN